MAQKKKAVKAPVIKNATSATTSRLNTKIEKETKTLSKRLIDTQNTLGKRITSLSEDLKKVEDSLNKQKVKQLDDYKEVRTFAGETAGKYGNNSKQISELDKRIEKAEQMMIKLKRMNPSMEIEQVAIRLVDMYFKEVARMGFKRTLDLDSVVNAYYYTLERLERKGVEEKYFQKEVERTERQLSRSGDTVSDLRQPSNPSHTMQDVAREAMNKEVALPVSTAGYSHVNKKGQKYFLHQRGKLFYFSKDPSNSALLPAGMRIVENQITGLPLVKKA